MRTSIKNRSQQNQIPRYLVAILCVLLILFVGAAQALHIHAPDEAANPGCSLCAVAHVSALPSPVQAGLVVAEAVAPVAQLETDASPQRFFSFNLYTRPPPAALTAHA